MKTGGSISAYRGLAERLVQFGRKAGADEIEVTILEGNEYSVDVRFSEIENLIESGSRSIGLRLIKDQKTAFASSSDFSETELFNLIRNAVKRAALANPDEYAGLPEMVETNIDISTLQLFDPSLSLLDSKQKIDLALETERIALQDKRITNSHGASFETHDMSTFLANSKGFSQEFEETVCSLSVGLQGGDTDSKVEGYWSSSKRFFNSLETSEEIANKAVQRTVRQLNPRKIKTQNAPVVFEPKMTSWLLAFLCSCVSGESVYRKTSFLAEKLGKKIAGSQISVFDDGLLPGKLGTLPFDSEGVPAQTTPVLENGVLKNFLCNSYAARKLGLQSTGNADGNSVGPSNFYMKPGNRSPEDIVSSMDRGLILTRTIGHGLNPVNGDMSRGAYGLWVEKGEIVFPVSEITISGNLGKILMDIEELGNDLEFDSPLAGPTIKVGELTIAGTSDQNPS
jgi:PmbA protein